MPASSAIIGRVAVKVLPDTDNFRADAERKLGAIEKRLKVTAEVVADVNSIKRTLIEGLREINAQNKTMDSRKVRFHAVISKTGLASAINDARRELQALADTKQINFKAGDLSVGTATLLLDRDSLDNIKDELNRWRQGVSPLQVDVEASLSPAGVASSSARLAVLTRPRTVPLLPYVDPAAAAQAGTALAALSGARVIHTYFDDIVRSMKNLDKNVPIIGTLALAVSGLSAFGLTAASNLFALSASLAQIGPAALVLPGIFGGIAIGVGTMVAALKDFHTIFPDVKKAFADMQDTISTNFWSEATTSMRAMLDTILPQLSEGLGGTGTALGGYFAGLADGVKNTLSDALGGMFADLAKSIEIATTGTDALIGVITNLGTVGAGYLPSLAQWFVDISEQFNNFLTTASADGRLTQWIDLALVNLQALGSSLASIGGIIMAIGQAAQAGGGATLTVFADTLNRIQAIVEGPAFQTGMTAVFAAAHQAMTNLATVAGPRVTGFFEALGKVLERILPLVGTALGTLIGSIGEALSQPAFTGGLVTMFEMLGKAVATLAPAFVPVGAALGALMPIIGTLAQVIAPLLVTMFQTLANVLVMLAPAITPLINVLGTALLAAFQALSPALLTITNAFGSLISGGILPAIVLALGSLVPVITMLAPMLADVLVVAFQALSLLLPPVAMLFAEVVKVVGELAMQVLPVLTPLLPILADAFKQIILAITPLVPMLGELLVKVVVPLITKLALLAAEFLPKLAAAIVSLVPHVARFISGLLDLWEMIGPKVIPVLEFLVRIILGSVIGAIKGIAQAFSGAMDIIQGVWKIISGIFTGDVGKVWDGIKQLFTGAFDLIVGAFKVWLNLGILGFFKTAVKNLLGLVKGLWDDVAKFFTGGMSGIASSIGTFFVNMLKSVGGGLTKIKQFFADAWTAIKGGVAEAFKFMLKAIGDGIVAYVKVISFLPRKALEAVGGISKVLVNAGKALIQGFIDGITDMFGAVQRKLGSLTDSLTSWKGPEAVDRVLLYGAGELVINGFIDGMESQYDAVRKSLQGLTKDVAGTTIDAPGINVASPTVGVGASLASSAAAAEGGGGTTKVFNYYAAPGSSLSSEEELFAASNRSRMVGW